MTEEILRAISSEVYGVWFLIGAALVFWMQAGFAMVETGFTRAKNAGNILMKNLMDFCIGTVMFICNRLSFLAVKIYWASSASPVLTSSPLMKVSTGPILYLILCSAQLPQPSYPGLWQKERNFFLTASTPA